MTTIFGLIEVILPTCDERCTPDVISRSIYSVMY